MGQPILLNFADWIITFAKRVYRYLWEMPQRLQIRPVIPSDAATWHSLRCKLWPDGVEDHESEIADFFVCFCSKLACKHDARDHATNAIASLLASLVRSALRRNPTEFQN
jgi:hypothetical protein